MRFVTVLCAVLLTASNAFGDELFISSHTDTLIAWTPKNWTKREQYLALPGSYARCGNYLFTFTPKHASNPVALIGFGIADARGGIREVVALDARDRRVRIWEAGDGTPPSVKLFSDDPKQTHTGYIIILPRDEYARVRDCLGVKKADPSKKTPKMISV